MQLSRTHLQSVPSGLAASTPPLTRLSTSIATKGVCGQLSLGYGKCVAQNYQSIEKDICKIEFENFKQCVQQSVSIQAY
ncbi:hypothetical protein KEM48_003281 [Puccinia striiformis f. sp. tritici PST-130]|uniref:CHCH domain-containing protein n=1 Tax=Puccinia striiformis TaxID=27350 RepID=A0A2S4VSC0_9BASI|nr:hypothetical protein KEM48_003281 [Puccinia striiformis f. sp. tritici PST-130]POW12422.1 hypothetical protein PSTT_04427 [Puccinia striiformis]